MVRQGSRRITKEKGEIVKRSGPKGSVFAAPKILAPLILILILSALAAVILACNELDPESSETTAATQTDDTQSTSATQAPGRLSAENILFRDDFQDGNSEGWQVESSWVVQQDGDIYTFDTTGDGFAYVPAGLGWEGDYAYRLTYLLRTGTVAFSFDATRDGRYYVAIGDGLISLVKQDANGDKTMLAQAEAPEIEVQHYLVIAKQEGKIQVYVDRTLWLAAEDRSPLTQGTIIVGSVEGTDAWVDNVMVNKILVTLPDDSPAVAAIDPSQAVEPADGGADLSQLPESDDQAPDLPDANLPESIPEPTVSFGAYPMEPDEPDPASEITVPVNSIYVLEWSVQDATGQFLDGAACLAAGSEAEAALDDTRRELEVIGWDGASYNYYVDITVTDSGNVVLAGPDLGIQVTVTPQEGRDVIVSIEVSNTGSTQVDDNQIYWYAHERSGVADFMDNISVPAGTSRAMDFVYTYGARGTMHWGARVSTEPLDADIDQSNNYVSGTVTID